MSKTPSTPENSQNRTEPSDYPEVKLTEEQRQLAEHIAHQRNESYREIDGGRIVGELTSLDAHEVGAVGEVAFAEFFDLPIDLNVYRSGDPGYDFRVDGCKIDIKTSKTTAVTIPDLIIPADDSLDAHIYILTHWEGDCVRFLGYAMNHFIQVQKEQPFPGESENIVILAEDLHPLPTDRAPSCHACRLFSSL